MKPIDQTPASNGSDHGVDTATTSKADGSGRRRHVPLRWLVIGGLVTVVAILAIWLGRLAVDDHQRQVASSQALLAARQYALTLGNIDSKTVDKSFDELFHNSTKQFDESHSGSSVALRQVLIDKKVVAHASIADATVESASTSEVTLTLRMNQSVTSVDTPQPVVLHTLFRIVMKRVGSKWLTDDFKLL